MLLARSSEMLVDTVNSMSSSSCMCICLFLMFRYVFYKYRNSLSYLSSVRETCRTKVVPQRMYKPYIIPRIVCTVFRRHTCESYPTLLLVPFSYSTTDFSSILSDTNLPNLFRAPFL